MIGQVIRVTADTAYPILKNCNFTITARATCRCCWMIVDHNGEDPFRDTKREGVFKDWFRVLSPLELLAETAE
jgi:hypothetical protein